MAATEANIGSITDFVHDQLRDIPETFLVLHPPMKFGYDSQLKLPEKLCNLMKREISIENPPDDSYWYRPEEIAFFGFAGITIP